MFKPFYLTLAFFWLCLWGNSTLAQSDSPFRSLFDGQSLQGWDGDARFWSVLEGTITGKTSADQPLDANTFLIWRGAELADFELRLKFRIDGGNSGIQYRSQDLGEHHVGGYQADIDAQHQYTGILYDERGRGILANRTTRVEIDPQGNNNVVGTTCDESGLLASIRPGQWSEYVVTAKGNHLTQSINGFVTVDVTDGQTDQAESRGVLALQIHVGPPMIVQFKDIWLRDLSANAAEASSKASDSVDADGCCCGVADACRPSRPRIFSRRRCRAPCRSR